MLHSLRSRNLTLLYHRIAAVDRDPWSLCVTPEHFSEHLEVLQGCDRVRLDEMDPAHRRWLGKPSVAITFDDGYADNYHAAAQILKQYDTPATFFIATGYIGETRAFWWDELERVAGDSYCSLYREFQPLQHENRRVLLKSMLDAAGETADAEPANRPMTGGEIWNLARESLFEIGAHTVTHPLLSAQTPAVQYAEIRDSKASLEALLDRPVVSFSYPYGGTQHYNEASVLAARDAGFSRACTTTPRCVVANESPFEWPRIVVTDMDGDQFQKLLSM